jgi:hypothetical protein
VLTMSCPSSLIPDSLHRTWQRSSFRRHTACLTIAIYHSKTSDPSTGDALQLDNFPLVVPVRKFRRHRELA